jgi:hypothetical protein
MGCDWNNDGGLEGIEVNKTERSSDIEIDEVATLAEDGRDEYPWLSTSDGSCCGGFWSALRRGIGGGGCK